MADKVKYPFKAGELLREAEELLREYQLGTDHNATKDQAREDADSIFNIRLKWTK
ncbi:MAG: hypothetical protein GY861_25045 [bacterium]|nr:hypothetical protein [bacterium]